MKIDETLANLSLTYNIITKSRFDLFTYYMFFLSLSLVRLKKACLRGIFYRMTYKQTNSLTCLDQQN